MDKSLLRLECLKLARAQTSLGPSEVIAIAEEYVKYCDVKEVAPSLSLENSTPPLPGVIGPSAGGKDHKTYSKK